MEHLVIVELKLVHVMLRCFRVQRLIWMKIVSLQILPINSLLIQEMKAIFHVLNRVVFVRYIAVVLVQEVISRNFNTIQTASPLGEGTCFVLWHYLLWYYRLLRCLFPFRELYRWRILFVLGDGEMWLCGGSRVRKGGVFRGKMRFFALFAIFFAKSFGG